MQNLTTVEGTEASHNLDENVPNFLFLDVGLSFLVIADLLEDITIVGILHHKAQTRRWLIYESIAICNNIRMVDRCKDAHFIKGVFLLPV